MRHRSPMIVLLILVMLMQLSTGVIAQATDTNYYSIVAPQFYKVKNVYELTNSGSNTAFSIKATILVGSANESDYQKTLNYKVTPAPKYTYVDSWGNIYAEVYISEMKAKTAKKITVEKEVENSGISYSKAIYDLGADYRAFKEDINYRQYLSEGEKIEISAPEIVVRAAKFDTGKSKVELAKDIYDFVNLYITYDTNEKYANKGALSAIRTARGVCDEYASLFVALCRSVGIPARVVVGYWLTDPLQAGSWNDISDKRHGWAEFYLPEVGWIPAEPTFIYTLNGKRTPNADYFANLKVEDNRHLISNYAQNESAPDLGVAYAYYNPTDIETSFGEQSIMPIKSPSAGNAFTDISSSWAKEYINKLSYQGILFAKQDGVYKPSDHITRAEFAAYLVNALRLEKKTAEIKFKDVTDTSDYAAFIKTAAAYGLIKGDANGYFKPKDTITRQDAAVIMQRAILMLGVDADTLVQLGFVDKNQISSYAKDAVALIYDMKIMSGKPGNIFDPKNFTTRAEAAKLLDNFINAKE